MPKSIALFFAVFSVLLMSATAIAISYNGWIAALLFVLMICSIGLGFVVSAKMKRRKQG
ncbi:DUF5325 family protein [Paenibacillus nasutitermitis]|uniref:DUF5325 family protein n=1 Tax=Paenibacillus nasutitermitis TaxID=1652958 RepID=A0A916Z4J3_9BACL|nr:DUF5325 family protein [Paenibacillus nasutitermitis]GGD75431.1 hypothetical protein GCM10010911_36710 [Paenibacillus nasutitermitis]